MGEQKKSSLNEWPEDLKDVVDWVLRISFLNQGEKLKDAVEHLEPTILQSTGLSKGSMQGLFNKVASGLKAFIGYGGDWNITGKGIGLESTAGGYTSSYKTATTWEGNAASDPRAQTSATILLYSFPLLYYGLTFVYWMCTRGGWQAEMVSGGHTSNLYWFLMNMGYVDGIRTEVEGQKIAELLGSEIDDLQKASAGTYPQFLKRLEENAKPNLPQNAYSYSLYALYAASHGYLTTKLPSLKNKELPQTQSDIANTLNGYSEAVKNMEPTGAKKLSTAYLTLLSKIKDVFNDDPPAPNSSTGAAAAGGVLGTAALGTTAALATNVGGITTTLKNLIPIFK
ncbi:variant erythrocyte surface antigen-1 family protein [Babesia caballi]|uniref:Variant erythrocyte surface antigen-1 family protein n=1 Tax=Babesia caballi TaxID=5871 RepID=A0AAV4LU04_BABCB|nr:variant erythrocyte surface antigen-1 family protein [Babesia caballi]